jgi:hypothetical protein
MMKRDMNLIRELMFYYESGEKRAAVEERAEEEVLYHVSLLLDAGLIQGKVRRDVQGHYRHATVTGITWDGHDFLDSARDPSVWKKAVDSVLRPGASWTFGLLLEFLKAEARRRFGDLLGLPPAP